MKPTSVLPSKVNGLFQHNELASPPPRLSYIYILMVAATVNLICREACFSLCERVVCFIWWWLVVLFVLLALFSFFFFSMLLYFSIQMLTSFKLFASLMLLFWQCQGGRNATHYTVKLKDTQLLSKNHMVLLLIAVHTKIVF